MLRDRTRLALIVVLLLASVLTVIFSARRGQDTALPSATPVNIGQVQTQAVHTYAQGLTSTARALPTSTPTDTPEAITEEASTASTAAPASVSPTPSCYRLKFLQDVTIPDNTIMTPAQVFTKTWQVQNTGLCAWRAGFQLVLIGGLAMGGSPYVLPASANPGAKLEVSIKMVAPTNQTGILQGTWRMTDDGGNQFGDALTVVIVVGSGTAAAPTASATGTP